MVSRRFAVGFWIVCTLALLLLSARFGPSHAAEPDAGFRIDAAPSARTSWPVTVSGDLPVVFVAIRTNATGDRRFEGPIVRGGAGRWTWVFTLPPVAARDLEIEFVAKDPYAPVPPDARPERVYARTRLGDFPSTRISETAEPPRDRGRGPFLEDAAPADGLSPESPGPPLDLAGLRERFGRLDPSRYPRPRDDNGVGMHWFPTCAQSPAQIDRFVPVLRALHVKWLVFLNNGSDREANRHLAAALVRAGILPVMRIYGRSIHDRPDAAERERLGRMVAEFRTLGVPYFQYLNEPNLRDEWGGRLPEDALARFADHWIPVAETIVEAGGIPGLPGPAPGYIDAAGRFGHGRDFFRGMVRAITSRGKRDLLERSFVALHNYTTAFDPEVSADTSAEGFFEFRAYRRILAEAGVTIPMIGTEGGTRPEDVRGDLEKMARWNVACIRFMAGAERDLFCVTPWLLTADPGSEWEKHAWIRADGSSLPVVERVKALAPPVRR